MSISLSHVLSRLLAVGVIVVVTCGITMSVSAEVHAQNQSSEPNLTVANNNVLSQTETASPSDDGTVQSLQEWGYAAGLKQAFSSQMASAWPDLTSAGSWCASLLRLRMLDVAIADADVSEASMLRVRQMKICDVLYRKFVSPPMRIPHAQIGASSVQIAPADIVYLLQVRNDIVEFINSHPEPFAEALGRREFVFTEILDFVIDYWAAHGSPPTHVGVLRDAILRDSVSGASWSKHYRFDRLDDKAYLHIENPEDGTSADWKWENIP